jgi:hypothetical protein
MSRAKRNIGFDGRMFLDQAEWETYCRRKPVRYIRRPKTSTCQVCGISASDDNPLQSAHVIAFDLGTIDLALTPEYLDSDENIVTAHRRSCNRRAELGLHDAIVRLTSLGVKCLPQFLPPTIHEEWSRLTVGAVPMKTGGVGSQS